MKKNSLMSKWGNLKDKEVTVLGLGESGFAACNLLVSKGSRVKVSDKNINSELKKRLNILGKSGVRGELGGHSEEFIFPTDLIVVSPGIPFHLPVLEKARRAGIPVIGEIELAYNFCPARIIAVTGTNGKTTTVKLISHLVKRKFNVHEVGNIGVAFSSVVERINKDDLVVMEISSFQLKTTLSFRPYIAVLLNITPDHLDMHENMDDYITSKFMIFSRQRKEDISVINNDEGILIKEERIPSQKHYFSLKKAVSPGIYLEAGRIVSSDNGRKEVICEKGLFQLPGEHNMENCLASVAVAHILGISKERIAEGIKSFRGLPHRIESIGIIRGVEFINDSKSTNVDSSLKALLAFSPPIILIMGGRDKGNDYSVLKECIRERVKFVVAIGESKERIKKELEGVVPLFLKETLREATEFAFKNAESGDRILLSPACSSFDMFKDYKERGEVFKRVFEKLK